MLFNRFIEIVIRNFETKEEFRVSSEDGFRIDFDYNEYLDQSSTSNTGTIKIYNLSIHTFQKIGQRFKTEVEIWCGYRNQVLDTVDRLCIGGLTSKSRERSGENYIITLEFQTAIKQLNAATKLSLSFPPKQTLISILSSVTENAGFGFAVEITKEDKEKYGEGIVDSIQAINFPHGISFFGTPKQVFDQICEMFPLSYMIDPREKDFIIWHLREGSYEKFKAIKDSLQVGNGSKSSVPISDTSSTALVLSIETGLVESPYIETVEIQIGYNEALDDNEELVKQKAVVPKVNKKGEVMKDKDGKVKYTKQDKNKTVARKVVNAKALINPKIKPNSWVSLRNTVNQVDGLYRVRNIKYNGSTHENQAFIMEMALTLMKGSID